MPIFHQENFSFNEICGFVHFRFITRFYFGQTLFAIVRTKDGVACKALLMSIREYSVFLWAPHKCQIMDD